MPKPKKPVLQFRTIVLSDVHLGTKDCSIDEVNFFIKHTHAPRLILNGDIIDGWSLKRKGGWNKKHTRFIRLILKKIEKKSVEVIYLRGNHDDILERFLPLNFGMLRIVDQYILEAKKGRYLITHGDLFDSVTQNSKMIAIVGDIGYQSLMRLNRIVNKIRAWRGKEPFSLSKTIKAKTKTIVNYISRFESKIEQYTLKHNCDGFICGHIHTPDNKQIGSIHYLNSGDWVESSTALVEHESGEWEVLEFPEFRRRLDQVAIDSGVSVHLHHEVIEEDTDENGLPIPLGETRTAG